MELPDRRFRARRRRVAFFDLRWRLHGAALAPPTILFGLVLDIIGLAFFAMTPDPLTNVLLSALIGVGQGAIEITINRATLRIDDKNSGRPMNLMHGACHRRHSGPMAVGVDPQRTGWTIVFRGMAAVFVLFCRRHGGIHAPAADRARQRKEIRATVSG